MKNRNFILATIFHFGILVGVSAQTENILQKAMKDEMNRSMNELKYEEFDKPFYISYIARDVTQTEIMCSLGSLLRSSTHKIRSKSVRVLVGDYEFNDESLDNPGTGNLQGMEIEMPVDDDYLGIRRAFWMTTDIIYKNAARKYKKNLETLKDKNKSVTEYPHRRFAKVHVTEINETLENYSLEKAKYEEYLKEISEVFNDFPKIENSGVYFSYNDGYNYFLNSEGTKCKIAERRAVLQVNASIKTESGESFKDQLYYNAVTPDKLPAIEEIRKEIAIMCKRLLEAAEIPVLDEEYSGPVLIVGSYVADVFANTFFGSSRESLVAPNILPNPTGYNQDPSTFIDAKLGKLVVNENITVKMKAGLKSFQNTDLI
jgi:hypothetical protein